MIEKIVLLSGPTATGKSSLASKLAEKIDGEIINADSIQLYRDLFILTARPDIKKEKIRHHCYGFLDGDINWSVGKWINEINKILKDVIKRNKVPIVVGGTGFYFKAITDGVSPIPDIDKSIRLKIENDLELIQVIIEQLGAAVSRYVPEEVKLSEARNLFTLAKSQLAVAQNSDERILWGRAMFGFAIADDDISESLDIINGKASIKEFTPDQDMRWGVITSAIAAGFENAQSLVAEELANDPTDRGERAALRANTSVPNKETKDQAWDKFTSGSGYGSLHQTAAAMSGFLWWKQVDLLTPYVERFFSEVTQVFETEENHFAQSYFGSLFPGYLVDYDLLEKSNRLLEKTPSGLAWIRLLWEAR